MKEKGFFIVLIGACIAGFGGIFINNISMESTAIAWMRTTVPTIFLGSILLFQGVKLFQRDVKKLVNLSFWSTLRILFFIMAYTFTSIGNAVVVFYTYPIFTLLLANRILDEQITKRQIVLVLLAFTGIIVIYSDQTFSFADRDFLGMLSALGASIIFAYVVILMKKMSDGYSRVEILFYQNFIGVFLFLPFFIMDLPSVTLPNLGFGIGYGLVIGVLVYFLFLFGLKRMKASIASTLMYVEIPSTIFFGWLLLDETLSVNFMIGAIMIVASSIMLKAE